MRITFACCEYHGWVRIFTFDTTFGPVVYVQRVTMGEA